ncbi:MAG: toll/interleukin-1 receptor domain-containing protein [Geminicoccaceae bacterium]
MHDIFVSYAREDLARIKPIVDALMDRGWSVFWDRTIPAGTTWREVIGTALSQARCVLVIWSNYSVCSRWVQEEAEIGLGRNILIPILIDDVKPPLGFGAIQAEKLINWDQITSSRDFEKITTDIESTINNEFSSFNVKLTGEEYINQLRHLGNLKNKSKLKKQNHKIQEKTRYKKIIITMIFGWISSGLLFVLSPHNGIVLAPFIGGFASALAIKFYISSLRWRAIFISSFIWYIPFVLFPLRRMSLNADLLLYLTLGGILMSVVIYSSLRHSDANLRFVDIPLMSLGWPFAAGTLALLSGPGHWLGGWLEIDFFINLLLLTFCSGVILAAVGGGWMIWTLRWRRMS